MKSMIVRERRLRQSESIAILLVGGQPVFRDALWTLFDEEPGFRIVGEAATPRQALTAIASLKPDIVLVGLTGRPLIRMMRALRNRIARGCDTRAIVMTTSPETVSLVETQELCVSGFMSRTTPPWAVIDGVRSVAGGDRCLERDPFDELAGQRGRSRRPDDDRFGPTRSEVEVGEAVLRSYNASLN
jgi:DNA-binding NarL/FixJ family response regulator